MSGPGAVLERRCAGGARVGRDRGCVSGGKIPRNPDEIHSLAAFWGRTHKKVIHFFTEAGDSVITAAAKGWTKTNDFAKERREYRKILQRSLIRIHRS